jgi:S1-C subfamily serine protease
MSQIVMHVYLSEAAYQPLPRGFLGVRMPTEEAGREADPKVQIVIESRLPGFDAYRKLRNGDGILDVEERPLRQPPDRSDFIDKVGAMRAGSEIHLKVLREGKVIRIAVRTGAFPAEIDAMTAGSADQFNDRRKAAAEKYVKEEFGALLEWE